MSNLREELQQIYDEHGDLTPRLLVAVASDPSHPLHEKFTWDDSEAAERFREIEASRLIRRVRIVYREGTGTTAPRSTRAFVAPRHPDRPGSYVPIEEAIEDPLTAKLLSKQMADDWKAMKRRWANYEEFWAMVRNDAREHVA